MHIGSYLRRAAATLLLLSPAPLVHAADIHLVATPSISAVIRQLGPAFETATGNKLVVQYGLVAAQKQKIEAGGFDLAIVPSEVIDLEITQGKISPQTRADIARTGLGVGMRAGAPKLDLATVASFKRALLKARSVTYVTKEPSGQHVNQAFDGLGIAAAMDPKIISQDSVAQVWKAVTNGDAELGIGFMPNVLSTPGVVAAGPFPAKLQFYTGVAAGIATDAQQPDAAKAFIKDLLGRQAKAALKENGFESAKR
jgi:molybdate transport system substrate-binding protein